MGSGAVVVPCECSPRVLAALSVQLIHLTGASLLAGSIAGGLASWYPQTLLVGAAEKIQTSTAFQQHAAKTLCSRTASATMAPR
jgi:hypothetical protein